MCILGGTIFWFFNALNKQDYNTSINYPLIIKYQGQDSLMVVGELPKTLRLNVSGGGWNLLRASLGLGIDPVEVVLNTPTETPYILGSSLQASIYDQVKSLNLNSILTDTLHFHIEQKIARYLHLAVDPRQVPLAADHLMIGSITLTPDSVLVEGPRTLITSYSDSIYLQIPETNIIGNYRNSINLPQDDGATWGLDKIGVQFDVDPLVPGQSKLPVLTKNFPKGSRLRQVDSTIEVKYQVPSSYADSLRQTPPIEVYVDYRSIRNDSTLIPQVISTHPYITDLKVDTSALKVIYDK